MNAIKTTLLLGLLTGLLIAIGGAFGGRGGMMLALVMAGAMNFGAYWFSDKIVLRMYGAKEVTRSEEPLLHTIVERLAVNNSLPMPKVYVIDSDSPNAFATGRNPEHAAVAATQGILRILTPDELEGVMAHELAHVKNRDILIGSIAATLAGAISMLGSMLQWGAILGAGRSDEEEGGSMLGGLALAIVAPIIAMLIQFAVSRSREYAADKTGAEFCGKPNALADALTKLHAAAGRAPMVEAGPATAHLFIVNPLSGRSMMALFSTHPPAEERVARLRGMAAGKGADWMASASRGKGNLDFDSAWEGR